MTQRIRYIGKVKPHKIAHIIPENQGCVSCCETVRRPLLQGESHGWAYTSQTLPQWLLHPFRKIKNIESKQVMKFMKQRIT